MSNPYNNEVIFNGQTLMSLKEDTVTPNKVLAGETFHDRSGAPQTGNLITHNVYDGLDSTSTSDALSANQGRELYSLIMIPENVPISALSNLNGIELSINYSIKVGKIVLISIILNNTSGGMWPQGGGSSPITNDGAVPLPAYNSAHDPSDASSIIDIVNRSGGRIRITKAGRILAQDIAAGAQMFTGVYIAK